MTTPPPDYTDLIARLDQERKCAECQVTSDLLMEAIAAIRTLSEHRADWERAAYDAVRAGV